MNTILKSQEFDKWLLGLKDLIAKAQVIVRIRSAQIGNFGDHASVGGGVYEMRIHVGPGYRVYYTRTDSVVYFLLLGGTKKGQQRDIDNAIAMAKAMKE
jgi:putative addiction module killer protein